MVYKDGRKDGFLVLVGVSEDRVLLLLMLLSVEEIQQERRSSSRHYIPGIQFRVTLNPFAKA